MTGLIIMNERVKNMISDFEAAGRLLVALALGAIVGGERQWRGKSAGLRTHVLVSMGSCLLMILSQNLYVSVQGLTNADPARLAAQVVSGIGFLGAGTIMKEGPTVVGLTTAATLWVVAAIGLAVGSGYMICALITTGLSYATLEWLSTLVSKCYVSTCDVSLMIKIIDGPGKISKIVSYLEGNEINICDIRIVDRENRILGLCLMLRTKSACLDDLINDLSNIEGVVEIKHEIA
jgi:putative Mg2+ transporter-C (MgtC) family protein